MGLPVNLRNGVMTLTADVVASAGRHLMTESHPEHTHSYIELMFVLGGSGVHSSSIGTQPLTIGDVALLRPGAWHALSDCSDLQLVNLAFTVDVLFRELSWTRHDPLLSWLLWDGPYARGQSGMLMAHLDEIALHECLEHLCALEHLSDRTPARYRADKIGRLTLLLGVLARRIAAPTRIDQRVHPSVVRAIHCFQGDLARDWTVGELAMALNVSANYLIRLFRKEVGLPPMAYLAHQRAEKAAMLLVQTNDPIGQIGAEVGWQEPSYFARRFRAHYGLSPSSFRRRMSATQV